MAQEAVAAELRRSTRLQGRKTPHMNEQALEDAQLVGSAEAKPLRKKAKRRKSAHALPHQHLDTEEETDSAASMDLQASPRVRALPDGHDTAQRPENEQMLEEIGSAIFMLRQAVPGWQTFPRRTKLH